MGKTRLLQAIEASDLEGLRLQPDQLDRVTLHCSSGDAGHKGQVSTGLSCQCWLLLQVKARRSIAYHAGC